MGPPGSPSSPHRWGEGLVLQEDLQIRRSAFKWERFPGLWEALRLYYFSPTFTFLLVLFSLSCLPGLTLKHVRWGVRKGTR